MEVRKREEKTLRSVAFVKGWRANNVMKHDRRPGGEVRVGNRENNKFCGGYVVLEALRDR